MKYLPAIFALLVAASGWFYLFYSRAAAHLGAIEAQPINERRQRLRRIGGALMSLLGVCLYLGFYAVDWEKPTVNYLIVWGAVIFLLLGIVVLALIDVRLTAKLRKTHRHDSTSR